MIINLSKDKYVKITEFLWARLINEDLVLLARPKPGYKKGTNFKNFIEVGTISVKTLFTLFEEQAEVATAILEDLFFFSNKPIEPADSHHLEVVHQETKMVYQVDGSTKFYTQKPTLFPSVYIFFRHDQYVFNLKKDSLYLVRKTNYSSHRDPAYICVNSQPTLSSHDYNTIKDTALSFAKDVLECLEREGK